MHDVQQLEQQLAEVTARAEALQTELNAFDPEFWDEIEDLKYERQQLAAKVAEYERILQDLPTMPAHV
jgi:DNA repair exonuclease SbcCD ATPase subunit